MVMDYDEMRYKLDYVRRLILSTDNPEISTNIRYVWLMTASNILRTLADKLEDSTDENV